MTDFDRPDERTADPVLPEVYERADSLLPAYGIQWVLAAGDKEIRLRTRSGRSGS